MFFLVSYTTNVCLSHRTWSLLNLLAYFLSWTSRVPFLRYCSGLHTPIHLCINQGWAHFHFNSTQFRKYTKLQNFIVLHFTSWIDWNWNEIDPNPDIHFCVLILISFPYLSPKASDRDFVDKLNSKFKSSPHYEVVRSHSPLFTVVHYAGKVRLHTSFIMHYEGVRSHSPLFTVVHYAGKVRLHTRLYNGTL